MATKKNDKRKAAKDRSKGGKLSPEKTDAAIKKDLPVNNQSSMASEIDRHPRPTGNVVDNSENAMMIPVGLDRDFVPAQEMDPSSFLVQPLDAVVFAASCTRSTINTTGSNADEDHVLGNDGKPNFIGNYHKGLKHDNFGEVDRNDYKIFRDAMVGENNFENIPRFLGRRLVNPQSGLATDLEGPNPKRMKLRSAPGVLSSETAAEAVELYWMALARDVPFTEYRTSALIDRAAKELSGLANFTGPKQSGSNQVTHRTIFRGCSTGNEKGHYLSQFLLKKIPYGSLEISQKQQTVLGSPILANPDYLTNVPEWLAVQNGFERMDDRFDGVRRYIRDLRDLGQYVHVDALYEAYLNACLILIGMKVPVDDGNPYKLPSTPARPHAKNQMGFGTFGDPHVLSLVCEVATRALKVVWYQKWFVHRRLRPEAYGGLVHFKMTGQKNYALDTQILNSHAVAETHSKYGTSLLPMAFPEGSPTHPAYGAGHATVAGACVTILKAWFDENALMPNPVVPTLDGRNLVNYTGPDANSLTIGGELNKLAANIAIGRNGAGVHWRSDYFDSIRLGERVAICILNNQRSDYKEDYSFTFTNFDGNPVTIDKNGVTGMRNGFTPCRDRDEDATHPQ